jgi:protein ImuA
MLRTGQRTAFADLREHIERLDGGVRRKRCLPFRVPDIDSHLPSGGLALGSLHEVIEGGQAAEFAGAATLYVAGIAARLKGPVLWCLNRRDLFAPGLARAGLHPNRVIYAETLRDRDILPVMEEGLKESGLAAVVGDVARLGLTASRRLQLAAEASGVPVFALRRWWTVAEKELTTLPSAAITRWRISPASSRAPPVPGIGRARWHVDLLRCRGAEPHSWILEACDEAGRLALPSDVADRSDQAPLRRTAVG